MALVAVFSAGVLSGAVSPSWAASTEPAGGGSAVDGAFPLGGGVEASVDARTGAFEITTPLSIIGLGWDSRGAAVNRFGFGDGWRLTDVGFIDTRGGVRVFPAKSVPGAFDADDSVPSGLAGYPADDVRFSQSPGVLPGREDGLVGERPYAFVLREVGGLVAYFDAAGDPVARVDAHGARMDWIWAGGHRLRRTVSGSGVITELDWADSGRVEVGVRVGAGSERPAGGVELAGGRVTRVTDATGAGTSVGYTPGGLVSQVGTASGARAQVTWRRLDDGSPAAGEVVVVDARTGERVTERQWEPRSALASGWPTRPAAGSPAGPPFTTTVTDGLTRLESTYSSGQALITRDTSVSTPSGVLTVQSEVFDVETGADATGPSARPTGVSLTYFDENGATRTVSEEYAFDGLGRVTARTAADRTATTTVYDDVIPPVDGVATERLMPIGLPVLERTEAPDGSVTETHHTLNAARTAVVASETFVATAGGPLTRTGRQEFDVGADGFVVAEREYPQGGEGVPLTTSRDRRTDPAAGTVTVTETVAVGTPVAATTHTVRDLVHGGAVALTDPSGRTVTSTYDRAGRVNTVTDALGNVTRTEHRTRAHDGLNATVTTRADGVTVSEEADVLGRVIRRTDNIRDGAATDGHVRVAETRAYPVPGTVVVTDAWGWATTVQYDVAGRMIRATLPTGVARVIEYDDVSGTRSSGVTRTGRLADAEFVTTQRTDANGRLVGTSGRRADGAPVVTTVAEYDGLRRQTRADDGSSDARTIFDANGNAVGTTITPSPTAEAAADPAMGPAAGTGGGAVPVTVPMTATRRFDERGKGVEKTLTDGAESRSGGRWEYDPLGRVRAITDQAGMVTSYDYTVDGLVARESTTAGTVTEHTYDPGTRELTESLTTSPVGAAVRSGYAHDRVTGRLAAVFDPVDPEATAIRYAYDAWGNPTATVYPDGSRIEHRYDEHGRRTHTVDAAGMVTAFERDRSGLLTRVVQHEPRRGHEPTASVDYGYDAFGRVTRLERGNGVTTEVTYTSVSEIASETTTAPDGRLQSERSYAYDAVGNVVERHDTVEDPATHARVATTTVYDYDHHRRLVSSSVHDGADSASPPTTSTEYTINASGDVTREQVTTASEPAGTRTRDFAYGPTGQLIGITTTRADGRVETATQEFDPAGNLVLAADGTRYVYNARNQPVEEQTPAGELGHTSYWASGDRATLVTSGDPSAADHATTFYWDDGTLHSEAHEHGGTEQTASYLLGASREARVLDGAGDTGVTYATHDRHGSTTELTGRSGAVVAQYAYRDYGAPLPRPAGPAGRSDHEAARYPFLFAGEYTNPSGTQHLAARTYAPEQLSFTSVDPMLLHNRYAYADANPIMKIDPSGHLATGDLINGLVIGLGVLFSLIGAATLGASAPAVPMTVASLMGAIGANAPSVIAAGVGVLADVAGSAIATVRFIHAHGVAFLDQETDHRLEVAEYVLLGAGAAGAVGGLVAARVATSRRLSSEIAHEQALLADGNVAARYFRQEGARLQRIFDSVTFQVLERQSVSTTVTAFKQAVLRLEHFERSYLFTAKSSWHGAPPTTDETMEFLARNDDLVRALDAEITKIQTAAEREVTEAWRETSEWNAFNDAFLPAKEDVVLSTIDVLRAVRTSGL